MSIENINEALIQGLIQNQHDFSARAEKAEAALLQIKNVMRSDDGVKDPIEHIESIIFDYYDR